MSVNYPAYDSVWTAVLLVLETRHSLTHTGFQDRPGAVCCPLWASTFPSEKWEEVEIKSLMFGHVGP